MDARSNGVRWLTVDDEGQEVSLHGREDGGLIVAAGSVEEGAGLIVLDAAGGRRFVAAVLNLLDRFPVKPEAADLLALEYPFPWWGTDNVGEDGIRRGVMVADHGGYLVLCAGRVRTPGGGRNTGAATILLEDAHRLAEAALAILDGVDPWEVTG